MKFQPLDEAILREIQINSGVMARRQIKSLFWPEASDRALERRLQKLDRAGFLTRPSLVMRKTHPIPEPVVWLGPRGAIYLAGLAGIHWIEPLGTGEHQHRLLQTGLRKNGFHWVREPPWSKLAHDIAVGDVRLSLLRSLSQHPHLILTSWWPEINFRDRLDVVQYQVGSEAGSHLLRKGVCPDAAFELINTTLQEQGRPAKARFLLEVDFGTEDLGRFGREKAAAGAAYIASPSYRARFGSNQGHWLVVTARGEQRLRNLIRQTGRDVGMGSGQFYFGLLEQVRTSDFLTSPIWWQVTREKAEPLIHPR